MLASFNGYISAVTRLPHTSKAKQKKEVGVINLDLMVKPEK